MTRGAHHWHHTMTRVVLVTGANRGIGRELARQLALRGDTVVLTARDLAKAERAAATLPDPQRVLAGRLHVTDPATIAQVATDLDRRYLRLDILVNNAAIHYDSATRRSNRRVHAWHGIPGYRSVPRPSPWDLDTSENHWGGRV